MKKNNIAEELGLPIRKTRGWKKNLKTSKT